MPLPYLGSKRKSAGKIYQAIKNLNPKSDKLYDLFCGGFAISEYFLKNGWSVVVNDKNKYVVSVLEQTILRGLDEEKCLEFVTREKFEDVTNHPDKYDDWYVGYVMCVWSFGNNQKCYLFGRNTELIKRAGHELVVNKNPDLIQKLIRNIPQKYIDGILKQTTWGLRRIALGRVSRALKMRVLEMQRLQQLERLEQLERLQQLEQLEQLEQLITFYSTSYLEVPIPEGAVIYCDPPYENTAEYRVGGFNYNEFWEWCRAKSKTNKVYVSSYIAPSDFKKILTFEQKSSLSGGTNKKQPDECLFTK